MPASPVSTRRIVVITLATVFTAIGTIRIMPAAAGSSKPPTGSGKTAQPGNRGPKSTTTTTASTTTTTTTTTTLAPTTFTGTVWHTAVTEWSPDLVVFTLDGVEIGRTTTRIPNTSMHWVLQTETALTSTAPADSARGNVQIDWVAAWAYDPAAP